MFWPRKYPRNFCLVSGKGLDREELVAFDNALINAGISDYNLLKVSSILPVGAVLNRYLKLKKGSALLTAYSSICSSAPGELLATAVAVGIPSNPKDVGVIMEMEKSFSGVNTDAISFEGKCRAEVKDMAKRAMQNHKIDCADILTSSISGVVGNDGYLCLISAVCLW
ncbi:pyruvoyl-dependent arginine decarboxylase [Candidatus Saccharibacteria bacterium]|nr:pyruvoyl-dependent arginine decarboxylase [Candidatus Saccharibacteria bacterium]